MIKRSFKKFNYKFLLVPLSSMRKCNSLLATHLSVVAPIFLNISTIGFFKTNHSITSYFFLAEGLIFPKILHELLPKILPSIDVTNVSPHLQISSRQNDL